MRLAIAPLMLVIHPSPLVIRPSPLAIRMCADADGAKMAWLARQAAPCGGNSEPAPAAQRPAELPAQSDPTDRGRWTFQSAPLVSELPEGPAPHLTPHDVVICCMVALQENDLAECVMSRGVDWGRRYNWRFTCGMLRAKWRGDADGFVREARNNPTGLASCEWFTTEEDTIAVMAATPTRGAICKMLVRVRPLDGMPMAERTFLWTLQQERRPPLAGCWLITQVLAMDRALNELTDDT